LDKGPCLQTFERRRGRVSIAEFVCELSFRRRRSFAEAREQPQLGRREVDAGAEREAFV